MEEVISPVVLGKRPLAVEVDDENETTSFPFSQSSKSSKTSSQHLSRHSKSSLVDLEPDSSSSETRQSSPSPPKRSEITPDLLYPNEDIEMKSDADDANNAPDASAHVKRAGHSSSPTLSKDDGKHDPPSLRKKSKPKEANSPTQPRRGGRPRKQATPAVDKNEEASD